MRNLLRLLFLFILLVHGVNSQAQRIAGEKGKSGYAIAGKTIIQPVHDVIVEITSGQDYNLLFLAGVDNARRENGTWIMNDASFTLYKTDGNVIEENLNDIAISVDSLDSGIIQNGFFRLTEGFKANDEKELSIHSGNMLQFILVLKETGWNVVKENYSSGAENFESFGLLEVNDKKIPFLVAGNEFNKGVINSEGDQIIPFGYSQVIPYGEYSSGGFRLKYFLLAKNKEIRKENFSMPGSVEDDPESQFKPVIIWTIDNLEADLFDHNGKLIQKSIVDIGIRPASVMLLEAYGEEINPEFHSTMVWRMSEQVNPEIIAGKYQRNLMIPNSVIWIRTSNGNEEIIFPSSKKEPIQKVDSFIVSKSMLIYRSAGKSGYITVNPEMIVSPGYNSLKVLPTNDFYGSADYILVEKKSGYGIINGEGKTILDSQWSRILFIGHDKFLVSSGGIWIHRYDTVKIFSEEIWDTISMENGLLIIHHDSTLVKEKSGVIGADGKWIIPLNYQYIHHNGYYYIAYSGGKESKTRKYSFNQQFDWEYEPRRENEIEIYDAHEFVLNGKCDVYSENGTKISSKLDSAYTILKGRSWEPDTIPFPYEKFLAEKKGKWGLMDMKGEWIIKPVYTKLYAFTLVDENKGMWILAGTNGKKNELITIDGKVIYSAESGFLIPYSMLTSDGYLYEEQLRDNENSKWVTRIVSASGGQFRNSVRILNDFMGNQVYDTIRSYINGHYILTDLYGNKLTTQWYDSIFQYPGTNIFYTHYHKKIGLIDVNGKTIFPNDYDAIWMDYSGNFIVTRNGIQELLDGDRRLLLSGYDDYYLTSDYKYRVRLNESWGLYDPATKKWIIPVEYEYIPDVMNGYYKVMQNMKYGLYSSKGELLLTTNYDELEWNIVSLNPDIAVAKKDNKFGFYDLGKKEWIIPVSLDGFIFEPVHDSLFIINKGGETTLDLNGFQLVNGGLFGMIDANAQIILPVEFTNISVFNPETETFKAVKQNKNYYFDSKGITIPNGETAWKKSWIGNYPSIKSDLKFEEFISPEGVVPTSFTEDGDGNWWLGTDGGGVYFSNDEGKTWSARNNGLGYSKVYFFLVSSDTIYTVYSSYKTTQGQMLNIYASWYSEENNSWLDFTYDPSLLGNDYIGIAPEYAGVAFLSDKANSLYMDGTDFIQEYLVAPYSFYPLFQEEAYDIYNEHWSGFILNEDSIYSGFPRDSYWLPMGNLYQVKNGTIVLHSSGVKFVRNDEVKVTEVSESGLKASSISQLIHLPSGRIIAKEDDTDVWEFKNGQWRRIFNSYSYWIDHEPTEFYTATLNLTASGEEVFFAAGGSLFSIGADGVLRELIKPKAAVTVLPEMFSDSNGAEFIIIDAVRDNKKRLWFLGTLNPFTSEYFLGTFNEKENKLIFSDSALIYSFGQVPLLLSGKNGDAILVTAEQMVELGSGNVLFDATDRPFYYIDDQDISFGPNGEIAWMTMNSDLIVLPKNASAPIVLPFKYTLTSAVGFDSRGRIYAAPVLNEDQFFEASEEFPYEGGLYVLDFANGMTNWVRLNNVPNENILWITFVKDEILFGTGGSGILKAKE